MADDLFATPVSATNADNDSTNPIFVQITDGTNTISVDASGNLQVVLGAETNFDTAAGGTDGAIPAAFVRDDALTTLTPVDGDYVPGRTNSTGAIWVAVDGSVTTTNTANHVDDAAFTVAVDSGTMVGGFVTSDSVDSGDFGAFRMLANRAQVITLEDAAGDGIAIDGSGNMAIDIAAQTLTAVAISKDASANSETNPIWVQNTDNALTNEIHDFDNAASVAGTASANHDYTAAGGVLLVHQVMCSASGGARFECINDAGGADTSVAVAFLNGYGGDYKDICFKKPLEVADTDVFRVTKTNRNPGAGQTQDLYSTIIATQL